MGGKRLVDYDCKIGYKKDYIIVPRKIKDPDDIRPGTKKGKLDRNPVWIVEVQMPKKLILDIYTGYSELEKFETEPTINANAPEAASQDADLSVPPATAAPGGTVAAAGSGEPTGGVV
jgi:hypothetical protein